MAAPRRSCTIVLTALTLLGRPAAAAPPAADLPELTVTHPVAISLEPVASQVPAGGRSALLLRIAVASGIWIGAAEAGVRAPGPTRLELDEDPCLEFGEARWPAPRVEGIPVRLGTTRVHAGRVQAVIPFRVSRDCPPGPRTVAARVTYTPGLDAGHLSPHIREPHQARLQILPASGSGGDAPLPEPASGPGDDLRVRPGGSRLPGLVDRLFFELPEDSALARLLHAAWEDPEDHGKGVRFVAYPLGGSSRNDGSSLGAGFGLIDTTREGIGTGVVNLRLFDNEFNGLTAALDAVSCPAAYHNYWLTAWLAESGDGGASFHLENLTRGGGRYGYEAQLDAFQDGRFRFFGLGAATEEENEATFTQEELNGELDLFWNFATNWRLAVGARLRRVEIDDPTEELAEEEASILERFPAAPGLGGATVVGERVTLFFDRRNQEFTPSRGTFLRLRLELDQSAEDDGGVAGGWGRFEALLRQYWSTPGQRYTLVVRNRWQLTTGEGDIPFWEQASLGGAETLRAFGEGRFVGRHSVFASLELRVQALRLVLLGMPMDVEISPFLDAGQVFEDGGLGGTFNVNPGLSMRILNRPNIGAIVNWAYGQDGGQFTGGVSLPF